MSRDRDVSKVQESLGFQLRNLNQDSLKCEIIKSFGPVLGNSEHAIPSEAAFDITEIKDGIAYSPNTGAFLFFDLNEGHNLMDLSVVLNKQYFDSDMYYWGRPPHEGIETDQEFKEWVEEQRTGNQKVSKAVRDLEKYVLNFKLTKELAMKENEQTKELINDPMTMRDEQAALTNGAARTRSNKIKI